MTGEFMFRKVGVGDLSSLVSLLQRYSASHWTASPKAVKLFLQRSDVQHFCVEQKGEIKGYACVSFSADRHAFLLHFFLTRPEDFTVGYELLDGILGWCEREGIATCHALSAPEYQYLFVGRGFGLPSQPAYLSRTLAKEERQADLGAIGEVEDIMKKTSEGLQRLPARKR